MTHPPGIRFKGSDTLASVHFIDQAMPADKRLTAVLGKRPSSSDFELDRTMTIPRTTGMSLKSTLEDALVAGGGHGTGTDWATATSRSTVRDGGAEEDFSKARRWSNTTPIPYTKTGSLAGTQQLGATVAPVAGRITPSLAVPGGAGAPMLRVPCAGAGAGAPVLRVPVGAAGGAAVPTLRVPGAPASQDSRSRGSSVERTARPEETAQPRRGHMPQQRNAAAGVAAMPTAAAAAGGTMSLPPRGMRSGNTSGAKALASGGGARLFRQEPPWARDP